MCEAMNSRSDCNECARRNERCRFHAREVVEMNVEKSNESDWNRNKRLLPRSIRRVTCTQKRALVLSPAMVIDMRE